MTTHTVARRSLLLLSCAVVLLTGGCFLQTISGATFMTGGGNLITSVRTQSILATCVQSGFGSNNVNCSYFITTESGVPVESTSTAELISEFGILGVVIDPLIYQIPGNATDITGTWVDEFGNSGNLDVLSGFRSIPIDIQRILFAEPGTKFVIAELPDGVPFEGVQFEFEISFSQPEGSPTPVMVKPVLSVKYEDGNGNFVFYPPMLPCAHSMADVPAIAVPVADTPQNIPIAQADVPAGCNDEFYPLLGFGVFACDFDADDDVDADDIALLASVRNSPALPGDRLDANSDGFIDLNDARRCARQCLQPRCASTTPREPVFEPIGVQGVRP